MVYKQKKTARDLDGLLYDHIINLNTIEKPFDIGGFVKKPECSLSKAKIASAH